MSKPENHPQEIDNDKAPFFSGLAINPGHRKVQDHFVVEYWLARHDATRNSTIEYFCPSIDKANHMNCRSLLLLRPAMSTRLPRSCLACRKRARAVAEGRRRKRGEAAREAAEEVARW